MTQRTRLLVFCFTFGLLPLLFQMGCSTPTYVEGFRFAPSPELVDVFARGSATRTPAASVMASIVGVRRTDKRAQIPSSIELRLRVEDHGAPSLYFDPRTLQLVTGTLEPFGAPILPAPRPITLQPGQTRTIRAFFPFPPGTSYRTLILDTLRLRWDIRIGNDIVPQTAYFERASPLYYEEQ